MALKTRRLLALSAALLLAGCEKPDPPPRRTEPWLRTPASASGTANPSAPRIYRFSTESAVTFSLSGKKGKLRGQVPLRGGELQLDARDLTQTRASIDADLTRLSIDTPPPEGLELGASPAELALQWLELGAQVPAERRAQFAAARFELHSLENLSPSYLSLGTKPSPVRATAVGTLLIHGFRAPVRVEVSLRALTSPSGTERVSIRSLSGLVVALGPHDITARDASGVVDTVGAARAAEWVGKQARVEFELLADVAQHEFK